MGVTSLEVIIINFVEFPKSLSSSHASSQSIKTIKQKHDSQGRICDMSPNSSPVKSQKPEIVLNQWCQRLSSPFQKPWTQTNVLYHYVPLLGAIDFHLLALNVLNPKLLRNLGRSIGLNVDCTNLFLAGSIAGGTLHLYNRRHMGGLTLSHRAMYSSYLGSLSVFGSVLLWAIGSRVVPGNPLFRTLLAVGSAWGMLKVKLSFLDHLDAGAKQR